MEEEGTPTRSRGYDVTYYVVCSDYEENGEPVCHVRVSPKYASVNKAKSELARFRRLFPDCRVWRYQVKFNPRSQNDMKKRQELLAQLV